MRRKRWTGKVSDAAPSDQNYTTIKKVWYNTRRRGKRWKKMISIAQKYDDETETKSVKKIQCTWWSSMAAKDSHRQLFLEQMTKPVHPSKKFTPQHTNKNWVLCTLQSCGNNHAGREDFITARCPRRTRWIRCRLFHFLFKHDLPRAATATTECLFASAGMHRNKKKTQDYYPPTGIFLCHACIDHNQVARRNKPISITEAIVESNVKHSNIISFILSLSDHLHISTKDTIIWQSSGLALWEKGFHKMVQKKN